MKSMKGLSVNKMLGSIRRKASNVSNRQTESSSSNFSSALTPGSTPEQTAHDSVKAFCESGGKVRSDEVLFLPPIVDAAESSPAAAAECARIIRKYLSKDYLSRPPWQYNAIMLMRILADNPGATFTRNLDQKFVDTARQLLKGGRDVSVRQILMETLDDFENTKMDDENLLLLVTMWKNEKAKAIQVHGGVAPGRGNPLASTYGSPQVNPHSQNYFARNHTNKRLPDPVELASRLEEARTSAKLLEQVVMNTPPTEMLDNDLIKEFADRCQSASRSIQGYMVSENPCPDNDTMENLIDTNEQLQTALNQHKRAVLNARKQLGLGQGAESDSPASETNGGIRGPDEENGSLFTGSRGKGKSTEGYLPPPGPPPGAVASGSGSGKGLPDAPVENPFADPRPSGSYARPGGSTSGDYNSRLNHDPSLGPGFGVNSSGLDKNSNGGDLTMHGAGLMNSSGHTPADRHSDAVSDISDDDLYDAPSKNKEPMYRY